MKALLDANVLFPTVQREMLLGVAARGAFEPLWSARLLGEWAHTAGRLGPEARLEAEGAQAVLNAQFPKAHVSGFEALEHRLWLPDAGDLHVLAAAIAGSADVIVTQNAKDFPRNILAEEGISRADPDGFLLGFHAGNPEMVAEVAGRILAHARDLSGQDWTMRTLLKKARLPRLGKALERG